MVKLSTTEYSIADRCLRLILDNSIVYFSYALTTLLLIFTSPGQNIHDSLLLIGNSIYN